MLALEQGIAVAKIKIGKYRNAYLVQARLGFILKHKTLCSKVLNVYRKIHIWYKNLEVLILTNFLG